MHLQALIKGTGTGSVRVRPSCEQVGDLRSGTGARASSIQPRLSGAGLLTLFIRPRNYFITHSFERFKMKVWLPR